MPHTVQIPADAQARMKMLTESLEEARCQVPITRFEDDDRATDDAARTPKAKDAGRKGAHSER